MVSRSFHFAPSVIFLSLLLKLSDGKDLGGALSCPSSVMTPSPTKPTNVNQIKFADIDVIAAMGDSLTVSYCRNDKIEVGLGAKATHNGNFADDRGMSYATGIEVPLAGHISLASKIFDADFLQTFFKGSIQISSGPPLGLASRRSGRRRG